MKLLTERKNNACTFLTRTEKSKQQINTVHRELQGIEGNHTTEISEARIRRCHARFKYASTLKVFKS